MHFRHRLCLLDLGDLFSWKRWPRERLLRHLRSIVHILSSVACIHWTDPAPDSTSALVLVLTDAIDLLVLMLEFHPICVHLPCRIGLLQIIFMGTYR